MREFTGRRHGGLRVAAAVLGLLLGAAGCSEKSSGTAYQPPQTWAISGQVTGAVTAGVTVKLLGTTRATVTDAGGNYKIAGLTDGAYTVEASRTGYAFTPATRSVTLAGADVTAQNFVAAQGIAIAGTVVGAPTGVTVTLTGPSPATTTATTTTDANGDYAFLVAAAGTYTVAPSLAGGWTFTPANSLVTVAASSVTGTNFAAIAPVHAITGKVTGAVVAGVTVTLSGVASASAVTDGAGNYSFTGLADGNYVLHASRTGYAFTPDPRPVVIAGADVAGQDFAAVAVHRLSGWVSGDVLAGVTVRLTGAGGVPAADPATTGATGYFEFTDLVDGTYTVTPGLDGYAFGPTSRSVTVSGADATGASFVATKVPTYQVSGAISGAVLGGVTLTLYADLTPIATVTSDGTGAFAFTGLAPGSYQLVATALDYTFTPESRALTVSGASVTGQGFVAALDPTARVISGTIAGPVTAGVTVALTGAATATATTDASGAFAFHGLADGIYSVTPALAGYAFVPADCLVTISGPSVTTVAFTGAAAPHTISGKVSGAVAAGVVVNLTGPASASTVTAGDGSYAFPGLADGTYTVTPELPGFVFGPSEAVVALQGADAPGVDFTAAATHAIAGSVTGDLVAGVKVTLSGAAAAETTTDVGGAFAFPDLPDGTYVVTPSAPGYTFAPQSFAVALAGADVGNANFTSTLVPTYAVSGTVTGAIVSGVTVLLSGTASTSTITDGAGAYAFTGLQDGSYMVMPASAGFAFTPGARAFTIHGADVAGQDFTSAVAP